MIMTEQTRTLRVKDKLRRARRHRRSQRCSANQLSGHLPEAGNNDEETGSRPRFRVPSLALAVKRNPPRFPMRVLLLNAKTMMYLGSRERWTKDSRQARDFRNGWWATVYAFTMNPRHLIVHYEFEDDRYNLNIPALGRA
jgi:hypothetical protein